MAKGLTKAKARTLIKREFGINPKGLKTPEYIDENPEFPFYELVTGNHVINVDVYKRQVHYKDSA